MNLVWCIKLYFELCCSQCIGYKSEDCTLDGLQPLFCIYFGWLISQILLARSWRKGHILDSDSSWDVGFQVLQVEFRILSYC